LQNLRQFATNTGKGILGEEARLHALRVLRLGHLRFGLQRLPRAGLYEASPSRLFGPGAVPLFRKNIEKYGRLAEMPQTRREEPLAAAEGLLRLEMVLPGHSVRLLELQPETGDK
jgi:hypothetical protein